LMVALHARRSYAAITRFRRLYPARPLLVALTGTDLYGDIRTSVDAQESLELATTLILLQPKGIEALPSHLHPKARVIYQSVPSPRRPTPRSKKTFDVCILGHLRPVKDPLRTALAARLVPATSRLRVLHVGKALSDDMAVEARTETAANPRYHWLGELPRWQRPPHSRNCWSERSATLISTRPLAPGAHAWHLWCIPSASARPGRSFYTKSPQSVGRRILTRLGLERVESLASCNRQWRDHGTGEERAVGLGRRPGQDPHPMAQSARKAMLRKRTQWQRTSLVVCAG
jgi:hypothetical protein